MPAPNVNTLPQAPARLSRPSSFVTDSALFLEALPAYRTQVNQFSSYINSQIPNKYNLGNVTGVRNFPTLFQTNITDIEFVDNLTFTSDLDALYSVVYQHSQGINNAGYWFDLVVTEHGVMPFDINKPLVSGVTQPMSRNQERVTFNNDAALFSETVVDNINSLYQSVWYTYITNCGNDDNGLITDGTITETLDAGSITDTVITY